MNDEPTLVAMRTAAEYARSANHHAYDAPRSPASLYHRNGALEDLLAKTRQLAEVLGEQCAELITNPPAGLYADDGSNPRDRAAAASLSLRNAADSIAAARHAVNTAWNDLSHLGVKT